MVSLRLFSFSREASTSFQAWSSSFCRLASVASSSVLSAMADSTLAAFVTSSAFSSRHLPISRRSLSCDLRSALASFSYSPRNLSSDGSP